jgi:hypothetical protein
LERSWRVCFANSRAPKGAQHLTLSFNKASLSGLEDLATGAGGAGGVELVFDMMLMSSDILQRHHFNWRLKMSQLYER